MQASAANGFMNTSIVNCAGTPYNFQPEYSTAKRQNIVPWAALQTNISTEFETGHYEGCSSVTEPVHAQRWQRHGHRLVGVRRRLRDRRRRGRRGQATPSATRQATRMASSTRHLTSPLAARTTTPRTGTSTSTASRTTPTGRQGPRPRRRWQEASWSSDPPRSAGSTPRSSSRPTSPSASRRARPTDLSGCTVPPDGPGHFYPYWTEVRSGKSCVIEFGNVLTVPTARTTSAGTTSSARTCTRHWVIPSSRVTRTRTTAQPFAERRRRSAPTVA